MAEHYPEAELVLDDELLFDDAPLRSSIARRHERAEDMVREGEVLAGKYRVERIPGRNGLGVLVQVRHLELGQEVTLKFLVPEACAYPEFVQRFVREARAAVRIQGEHVARVTDVGRLESGAPYMVREYLRGPDLSEVLKVRGPLPVAEAVDYIVQAAEGVAEGHALGIVHRNLRPTSLVVARRSDGTALVKVFDFAASESLHVNPFTERAVSLVGTSAIMASLPYLAPEQIRDPHDVDFRADIYSLGAVLFELLTGNPVYFADAAPALLAQVAADAAPSLRNSRPDLPAELDHVVLRCLAKNRAIRYSSLSELALALKPFASPEMSPSIERIQRLGGRTSKLPPSGDCLPPPPIAPPARVRTSTLPLPGVAVPSATRLPLSVHDDVTSINPYAGRTVPLLVREPAPQAGTCCSAPRDPMRRELTSEPAPAPMEAAASRPDTPQPPPLRMPAPPPLREDVTARLPEVQAAATAVREPSVVTHTPSSPTRPDVIGSEAPRHGETSARRHDSTMMPPRSSMSGLTRSWAAPEGPPAPLFTSRRLATVGALAAGVTLALIATMRAPARLEPAVAAHAETAKPVAPPAAVEPALQPSADAAASASASPVTAAAVSASASAAAAPAGGPLAPAPVAAAPAAAAPPALPAPARAPAPAAAVPIPVAAPARVAEAPASKPATTAAPARKSAPSKSTDAGTKATPAAAPKLASASTGDLFDGPK